MDPNECQARPKVPVLRAMNGSSNGKRQNLVHEPMRVGTYPAQAFSCLAFSASELERLSIRLSLERLTIVL
jgi:hypothetical protein